MVHAASLAVSRCPFAALHPRHLTIAVGLLAWMLSSCQTDHHAARHPLMDVGILHTGDDTPLGGSTRLHFASSVSICSTGGRCPFPSWRQPCHIRRTRDLSAPHVHCAVALSRVRLVHMVGCAASPRWRGTSTLPTPFKRTPGTANGTILPLGLQPKGVISEC